MSTTPQNTPDASEMPRENNTEAIARLARLANEDTVMAYSIALDGGAISPELVALLRQAKITQENLAGRISAAGLVARVFDGPVGNPMMLSRDGKPHDVAFAQHSSSFDVGNPLDDLARLTDNSEKLRQLQSYLNAARDIACSLSADGRDELGFVDTLDELEARVSIAIDGPNNPLEKPERDAR
jgi:hypothetical protein